MSLNVEGERKTADVTLWDQEDYDKFCRCTLDSYPWLPDDAYSPPRAETVVYFDKLVDGGTYYTSYTSPKQVRVAACLW